MACVWRWTKRLLLGVVVLVAALLLAGVGHEQWSRVRLPANHPPPGEPISVDGRRQHIYCAGEGGPTVIMVGQSSDGSPPGAIFTTRGSNRASLSTRSSCALMTSSMSL